MRTNEKQRKGVKHVFLSDFDNGENYQIQNYIFQPQTYKYFIQVVNSTPKTIVIPKHTVLGVLAEIGTTNELTLIEEWAWTNPEDLDELLLRMENPGMDGGPGEGPGEGGAGGKSADFRDVGFVGAGGLERENATSIHNSKLITENNNRKEEQTRKR